MNEQILIEVLMRHIPEITQWVNEVVINNVVVDEDDPLECVPLSLRSQMVHPKAFANACEQGLITIEHGRMVSHFANKCQLTYFCGRCFAGDCVVGRLVLKGNKPFPAAQIERLFGVTDMKNVRKKLRKNKLPRCYQVIDLLFDK